MPETWPRLTRHETRQWYSMGRQLSTRMLPYASTLPFYEADRIGGSAPTQRPPAAMTASMGATAAVGCARYAPGLRLRLTLPTFAPSLIARDDYPGTDRSASSITCSKLAKERSAWTV